MVHMNFHKNIYNEIHRVSYMNFPFYYDVLRNKDVNTHATCQNILIFSMDISLCPVYGPYVGQLWISFPCNPVIIFMYF